jgi:hypothetical protein
MTWTLVPRKKNNESLAQLGFTLTDVKDQILDLVVNNYIRGPFTDQNEKGDFWEFGKMINDLEIYIKLKQASFANIKVVRIVSFHISESPIKYPYKE